MKSRGDAAEDLALDFLQGRGLTLVERNYRCKFGEIDLVLRDGLTLVFVEVRMRSPSGFVTAVESVTGDKQRKLIKTAEYFLTRHGGNPACRFDVVVLDQLRHSAIEWIPDAFGT
jgi:putative endonuclease